MLSDEQIKQFQALYQRRFGVVISREKTLEQGTKLIRLIGLIYQPMTEKEYQKLQNRRKTTFNL